MSDKIRDAFKRIHAKIIDGRIASAFSIFKEGYEAGAAIAQQPAPAAPVAHVSQETYSADGTSDIITRNLPVGTPLYAAPPAAEQQDAVKVPRELASRLCHRDNYTRQMARRELRTLLAGDGA